MDKLTLKFSLSQKIVYLLTHFDFMLLLFGLTAVYFITTGIQFWITDYWVSVLHQDKAKSIILFSFLSVTGPVIGVVCGGYVFDALGGYTSHKAFPVAVIVITLAGCFGFPVPVFDNLYICAALLWA